MISIYAFPLFLWICLAVQVPTQGALTKITKVKRVDLGEEFKLLVEFESDSPVTARWWKYESPEEMDLSVSEVEGKTTLKISKIEFTRASVFLRLGDMPSHFVSLWWNTKGDGDRVSTRDCPLAVITPGLDLVNVPNQEIQVKIAVEEERGLDYMSMSSRSPVMVGQYWDEASNSVLSRETFNFLEKSQESENGVMNNILKFNAEQSLIGYFQGIMSGYASDKENAPVLQMIEFFTVAFHKEGEEIPFDYDLN